MYDSVDSGNIFLAYLKKINQILIDNSNLDDINVTEISKQGKINLAILFKLIEKIREIVYIFRDKFELM